MPKALEPCAPTGAQSAHVHKDAVQYPTLIECVHKFAFTASFNNSRAQFMQILKCSQSLEHNRGNKIFIWMWRYTFKQKLPLLNIENSAVYRCCGPWACIVRASKILWSYNIDAYLWLIGCLLTWSLGNQAYLFLKKFYLNIPHTDNICMPTVT